jgi:polyisoprenoid-binding protein YceI
MKLKFFILIVLGLLLDTALSGQSNNKYLIEKNEMIIKGTSNLHDWEMDVKKVKGSMDADIKNNKILSINSLTLNIDVNSIKSGKSLMDKKTYNALKSEFYPEIRFDLSGITDMISNEKGQLLTANGILSIAGSNKSIRIKALSSIKSNGELSFTGSKSLKMSDFDIEPPTAIFGTLKTGNEVVIEFKVIFRNYEQITKR